MLRIGCAVLLLLLFLPAEAWCGLVSEREVQEALSAHIRQNAPAGVEMVGWSLVRGGSLPVQGRIAGVERVQRSGWQEKTTLCLRVETEPGREKTLWIAARLRFALGVVVACRSMPIGHRISAEDVRRELREGRGNLKEDGPGIEEVVGRRVWRPISEGALIRRFHIREDSHVKSGDTVVIVTQTGQIRVEAPGKILEPAKLGDRVRVVNVLSGKEILATVLDAKTVSVTF